MTTSSAVPVHEVNGSNYKVGFEAGKRFRRQITDFLSKSRRLRLLRDAEKRSPRLKQLMKYGEKHFPRYMDEIIGVAEGSDSSLTEILLINLKYDFPRKRCTTVMFREDDRLILAHNEDNTRDNSDNCYLLKVFPEPGVPFISFCYPGMIPGNSFSFNAHGLIIANNAMPTPDLRIGCPRHLIDRSQLQGENLEDAIRRTLFRERASGGSFNIVSHREKATINIETTSQRHCITEVADKYIHTNHYTSKEFSALPQNESSLKSSISRYKVGSKLLLEIKEKTPQTALDILSSLEAKPYSILRVDKRMRVRTLFTALFDASDGQVTMKVYEPKPKMQEDDVLLELALDDLT